MSRWLIGTILVILASATTILLRSLEKTEQMNSPNLLLPDYTLDEFKTVRLDPQGHLQEQLTAQKMVHYTDRSTELTTLEMIFYRQGKAYWTVQAERGKISAEGHEMWLQGNTILWWDGRLEQERVEIVSQDVYLRLDQEYAETQAPTTIRNHRTKTEALGAKVFLPNKRIELLSKVRGSYELH